MLTSLFAVLTVAGVLSGILFTESRFANQE